MDAHDHDNVQVILWLMAQQYGCTVRDFTVTFQQMIDRNWENARSDPEEKAHWDKYFPDGKPTTEQYILCLGHAHERNEELPYFFKE